MKKRAFILILSMLMGLTACSGSDKDKSAWYDSSRTVINDYDDLQSISGRILYSDKDHILYSVNYSDADSASYAGDLYLLDGKGSVLLHRHRDQVLEIEGSAYISEYYFFIDGEVGVMRLLSDIEKGTVSLQLGRIDEKSGEIKDLTDIDIGDSLMIDDSVVSVDCITGVPRIVANRGNNSVITLKIDEQGEVRVNSYGKSLEEFSVKQISMIYTLDDGSLLLSCRHSDIYDNSMIKIDTDSGDVSAVEVPYLYLLPVITYGAGDPLFMKGSTLCSYGADGVKELFDIDECEIGCYEAGKMTPVLCGDRSLFIASEGDELVSYSFKKRSKDPNKDKTKIKLAHVGPVSPELAAAVEEFNGDSDDRMIVFDDDYMSEAYNVPFNIYGYSASGIVPMASSVSEITERLEDDIKAGKGPDIVIDAHLLTGLSDKALIDTSEYCNEDEDIFPCAFENGDMVVYRIDSMGLLIDREELTRVLGDKYEDKESGSITLDDYLELLDSYGGSYTYGFSYLGPAAFNMCLPLTEDDDIAKLWEAFAKEGRGETMESSRVFASLADAVYYQSTEQIASDAFLTSMPSSAGGEFTVYAAGSAALTSCCSDKEAAGGFIAGLLDKDIQEELRMDSVRRDVFSDSLGSVSDASDKFIKAVGEGRLVSYPDASDIEDIDPVVIDFINGKIDGDKALDKIG